MKEIWKDIEGFEGLYQISNLGRVKSLERQIMRSNGYPLNLKERILKTNISKAGREGVQLSKNSQWYHCWIHRLVAKAFIPNPDNLPQVNHKDENPLNNCIDNLEWCTNKYNHDYGTRNIRQARALMKKVNVYDLDMNYIETLNSLKEVSVKYHCDQSGVTKVCKGINKYIGNIIVRYAE